MEDVTADFMYLRLHGDKELYASGYSDEALERWAARIRAWTSGGQPDDAQPDLGQGRRRNAPAATCSATSTTTSRCTHRSTPSG